MDWDKFPVNKLINIVAEAIGIIYEPTNIKRIARAEAEAIEVISQAIKKNDEVAIRYQDDKLMIEQPGQDALIERAKARMALSELKKQYNIDSTMSVAIASMENATNVSEEKVNIDWIYDFFEKVGKVSDVQLQKIWGEILAGEVCTPRTYSKRTLDVLSKLTANEAVLFSKIVPFVLNCQDPMNEFKKKDYFIPADEDTLIKFGIIFDDIFVLSHAGLIDSNIFVSTGIEMDSNCKEYIYWGNSPVIEFTNNSEEKVTKRINAFLLTQEGRELLQIVKITKNKDELEEYYEVCKSLFETPDE